MKRWQAAADSRAEMWKARAGGAERQLDREGDAEDGS